VIKSVVKAIQVMNLFSATEPRLSVTEVGRRLQMPKSTAHSFLKSLASQGFVERIGGDLYALGTAVIALTQKYGSMSRSATARHRIFARWPTAPANRST